MFKHDKLYVCDDIADREALCKRLTDNGATIVPTVGEQDSIHIFNSFEGVLFDDCLKKGCRIIGLPCLQETLQSGKALPRTPYPVYSRVMEGIVVSSDVVEQKAKLKSYVHQMNGIWADELSGDTQYFITNEPGSIHYLWALEYGSNIVQPSWITESWENRVLSNPKSHVLPPLHGCVISVTGFSVGTRNTIQNLVMHYGGKYMQQLSRKVTHLLCDKPGGRKFATAVSWGIHVVNTNWLYDSINAKGMVDATRYEMPPEEGHGGDTLRSPYSRSGPYGSLSSHHHLSSSSSSSSRPRIVGFAPVLVRRNRVPASNYAPMFSIPSTHQHQFAQTSQIQASSHHSLGLSHSSLRNQPIPQRNRPPPRSRDREGRTSMDKYRDMIEQVTGLLRMCDDIIEKTTAIQNTNNNNNDITNFSNILNSSITSNIKSLYNNLDQLCNNSNDNISNDITTTTTTTSSALPDTNNNNNNTNTTTNNKDNSATDIQTNKEESTTTDMEMESDDEPPSSATPSEHEK